MEEFVKGDIVVLPFPFSDLSANKRRPALVVARGEFGDTILCQITSRKKGIDNIEIAEKDFHEGGLKIISYAKPRKIFTSDIALILYRVGKIKKDKIKEAEDMFCRIFKE